MNNDWGLNRLRNEKATPKVTDHKVPCDLVVLFDSGQVHGVFEIEQVVSREIKVQEIP